MTLIHAIIEILFVSLGVFGTWVVCTSLGRALRDGLSRLRRRASFAVSPLPGFNPSRGEIA